MSTATDLDDAFRALNDRRIQRTRQLRNATNIVSVANLALTIGWVWFRSFYCWDSHFCDPLEELFTCWRCWVCQADVAMMFFLGISTLTLSVMLVILHRHVIFDDDGVIDDSAQRSNFAPAQTVQSIRASARFMGLDGPGIWTTIMALVAIVVGLFYITSPYRSLTRLWW